MQAQPKPGGGLVVVLANGEVWESLGMQPNQTWRRVNLDPLDAALAEAP